MTKEHSNSPPLHRRDLLLGACAASAVTLSPTSALSSAGLPLHVTVANRARALANGRAITLRLLLPNGSAGNVDPVAAAFKRLTGISIVTTETDVNDLNTELSLHTFSQTQSYDVALPATFGLPDLVAAGAIQPLSEFANRYEPAGFRDDILFATGDSFDGETYGFQTDGDAYLMFYNKEMLNDPDEQARYADLYGTPLVRPNIWGELDRQMAYFHRPDQGQFGGLLFRTPTYLAWEWWIRFHAKGLWPFSADMDPQIATDAGEEALEDMIRATQSLHPDVATLGLFENWDRFERGDVFCNLGWGGSQKFFNRSASKMRGKLVFGPTPGGMIENQLLLTPYFNWGWNYVVVSNSPIPEISYLFALFASSPEMSTLAVGQTDGFFDPFRPEHYKDEGIQSAYSDEFLKVHRASLRGAIPDLYLTGQSEYFRVLGDWLARAIAGDVKPKLALERVADRWRLITNSTGRDAQIKRWQDLRTKYPVRVRNILRDIA